MSIKNVIIAFLNPGFQLSDAQFAVWYDLQKFKRRTCSLLGKPRTSCETGFILCSIQLCNQHVIA